MHRIMRIRSRSPCRLLNRWLVWSRCGRSRVPGNKQLSNARLCRRIHHRLISLAALLVKPLGLSLASMLLAALPPPGLPTCLRRSASNHTTHLLQLRSLVLHPPVCRCSGLPGPASFPGRAVAARAVAAAAAAAAAPPPGNESVAELLAPNTRHQPPLDPKARKAKKAFAETLAREKRLVRVQVGSKGITQSVVDSCIDVLLKHEFVRVKLGEGSGYERKEAAQLLEQLLDAVAVHAIGFTVTLYRQAGLPAPSNYGPGGPDGGSSSSETEGQVQQQQQPPTQQQQQQVQDQAQQQSTSSKPRRRQQHQQQQQPTKPPSVTLL